MKARLHASIRLAGLAFAGAVMAWSSPAVLAANAPAASRDGVYYSESVGVSTPDEHITGSTSSRDAKGAPLKEEQALLDKVVKALVDDSQLHGTNIHVKVERDSVVLTGKAKNASQARHARDVAQNAANGAKVESKLRTG